MVKILTESTSDLSPEQARQFGITVVPLWVNFGQESYLDRVEIQPEEFYRRLVQDKVFPTTAAPAPGAFAEAYDKLAEETDEILALIISSKCSATYGAAIEGLELRKNKNCRIEVIDTLTTIGGLGLLAVIASEEARRGASLDEVKDKIMKYIPRTHTRICFDTLKYLHKGGRIGSAKAFLGSMFRIHPIIGIIDGYTEGVANLHSREKALDWLYNFVAGFKNIRALAVENAAVPEEAEQFAQRLSSFFPAEKILRSTFTPVVGAHLGPYAIGIAVVEEI